MKRESLILSAAAVMAIGSLTSCDALLTSGAIGPDLYMDDYYGPGLGYGYVPSYTWYYPSNPPIVGNGPGSVISPGWGNGPGPGPGNDGPGQPGNNPGSPSQGGFRGNQQNPPRQNQPQQPPYINLNGSNPGPVIMPSNDNNPGSSSQGGFRGNGGNRTR